MTEDEWRHGVEPGTYPIFEPAGYCERKMRLIGVGACRRNWHLLKGDRYRNAVLVAEKYAEGLTGIHQLRAAHDDAWEAVRDDSAEGGSLFLWNSAAWCVSQATIEVSAEVASVRIPKSVCEFVESALKNPSSDKIRSGAMYAAMMREFFGEQQHEAMRYAPESVLSLARTMYAGDNCAFALHDALLEGGQTELAEHFNGPIHPKGCWALDLILGKQ